MTRRKDREQINPNVHFINSLKAAKKREKGYKVFTAPTVCQTVYWGFTFTHIMARGPSFAGENLRLGS